MQYYPKLVTDALTSVIHPEKKQDIVTLGMVADDIRINGRRVTFSLIFDRPNDPMVQTIKKRALDVLAQVLGPEAQIEILVKVRPREQPQGPKKLPGVRNVIAVASGKGGVGKSTVTANLAVALTMKGYKVGLLDADIFGPSVPMMFGTQDETPYASEKSTEQKQIIEPVSKYGVKMLSIGYFVDPQNAVLWRGGMASNAIKQLLTDADWEGLDYLLIDMPPGTSDIHITLVQTAQLTGVIVVSTPQKVALADAVKAINMFQNEKIDVPILGIVENMAYFTPAELPDNKYYIFGRGGAAALASEKGLRLLGEIPIVQGIMQGGDDGRPAALEAGAPQGKAFHALADKVISVTGE